MLSLKEIQNIAGIKGIKNIGNAEKDYLLDMILLLISRNTKNELVFKGGTCLCKFYNLERFSEDLDFTLKEKLDVNILLDKILSNLSLFGINAEIKEKKEIYNSSLITLKIKGPLYTGNHLSFANIKIDINKKSKIELEPELKNYSSLYQDIPSFSIKIMNKEEILAEKVRAIITRNSARDLYDLDFLLKNKTEINLNLINKKLSYYNKKFSKKEFTDAINKKDGIWESELSHFILGTLPKFKEIKKFVLNKF